MDTVKYKASANVPPFLNYMADLMHKYGGVWWPLWEQSGSIARSYNTALAEGRNIVLNGTFDSDTIWGKGTGWSITAGVAHCDGSQSGATNLYFSNPPVRIGATYRCTYTVSNYSAGQVRFGLTGGSGWTPYVSANGVYSYDIVHPALSPQYVFISGDADFIGDIDDVSVTRLDIPANDPNFNGATTGATVGQTTGLAAVPRAYLFDGVNDQVVVYSAEFNSLFNPTSGTLLVPFRIPTSGIYTDGAIRQLAVLASPSLVQGMIIRKDSVNNQLNFFVTGTTATRTVNAAPITATGWQLAGLSFDGSGMLAYLNGLQIGTTQATPGTLNQNLSAVNTLFGDVATVPAQPWSGLIASPVYLRGLISPAEHLRFAQLLGVA